MNINVSFDPVRLLGNATLAFIGGFVGNLLAAIIVAANTPSLDGGSLYAFAGLLMLATSMFFVKAIVAAVIAVAATALASTPRKATIWSLCAGAAAGLLFTLLAGVS